MHREAARKILQDLLPQYSVKDTLPVHTVLWGKTAGTGASRRFTIQSLLVHNSNADTVCRALLAAYSTTQPSRLRGNTAQVPRCPNVLKKAL